MSMVSCPVACRKSARPARSRTRAAAAAAAFAALTFSFLPSPAEAKVVMFGIDPYHSQAIILVDHFAVSHQGGMFGKLTGTIHMDAEKRSDWDIDVVIPVFEFVSTHAPRTEAVKGEQFLDAASYPEMRFRCKKVDAAEDGSLTATGEMTIRGVTKEVSFPLTMRGPTADPIGGVRIGIEGDFVVKRSDFGIPFNRTAPGGEPVIGEDVRIMFQVEAIREGSRAKKPEEVK